ncbi:MAG: penicillin-binding protein [Porphyromonas sp.]|nr:penicillin-binding protein [Porphyromonas sp.]
MIRDYDANGLGRDAGDGTVRRRGRSAYLSYLLVGLVLTLLSLLILVRTIWTATVDAADWRALNANMKLENRPSQPVRGNIFSDTDSPLAVSVPRYDTRIDFRAGGFDRAFFMEKVDSLARSLSSFFGDRSAASYRAHLLRGLERESRSWKVVDREVTHTELRAMQEMPYLRTKNKNKTGFTTTRYIRRVMPYGSLAGRTIGSLKRDPDSIGITHGNSGLELAFDEVLCGKQGLDRFIFVPGTWVRDPVRLPKNGMNVFTTINVDIQDITERALREELTRVDADWGTAVVMEVKTGAIKAIANLDRVGEGNYQERTNHALADLLEPGSTFKSISLLAALETGKIQPGDTVDVGNGLYRVGKGLTIVDHNAHKGGYGKITLKQVLGFSSNVGTAIEVMRAFGKPGPSNNRAFYDALNKMNVFDKIDLEIPGTAKPYINPHPEEWQNGAMPWISFGYQVQMPPIYTLRFYNAVANGGKMMEPYLVTKVSNDDETFYENGSKVVNEKIASDDALEKIRMMIRSVVTEGTGKAMNSPYVLIAGKTGTAQMLGPGGYKGNGHNVTFCGYFPADNPIYSCIVVVSHPRGVYPSGSIPGAVLRAVAEQSVATSNEVRLEALKPDSTATFVQSVGGGLLSNVERASRLAGIKLGEIPGDGNWVTYSLRDSVREMRLTDPATTRMPNLTGMSVSDAVFLSEMLGLNVSVAGKGAVVVRQTIPPERTVREGNSVTLILN